MADVYAESARRREENALANDLANNAGYDPQEVQDFRRRGGNLKSLVTRPKPVPTREEEEMDLLKTRAEESRLRRSINPTKVDVDATTGEMFDTQTDDQGRRVMTPQKHSNNATRYRPKVEAFEGTNEEGDKWAMDRDEFGAAKDYRITKPHTDKIVKVTLADGKVVNTRRKEMPDGSFEHEEITSTVNGKPLDFSKHEREYENRFVKGKEKRGEKGEWAPDTNSFEPSETVKKTHGALSRELTGTKQEIFRVETELSRYPNPDLKSKLRGLQVRQKNIEGEIGRFEDVVKREAGEPVLQKLRGFKGEYPDSTKDKESAAAKPVADKQTTEPVKHPQHDAAADWLKNNPKDPRAPAVRKKLGL